MIEPIAEILTDEAVSEPIKRGEKPITIVKSCIKNHKKAIIEILALLEGVAVEEYVVPPPAGLLMKLMNLINDPMVQEVFTLQGQIPTAASSGSATAKIKDEEQDGA